MDVSYSEVRQNLKANIAIVQDTHEPIFITSHKKRQAVLMSYADYSALEETAYLLRSPAMAKRLLESIEDMKTGKGFEAHDLIDVDDET